MKYLYTLLTLTFMITWGYLWLEQQLIDAYPLEEIQIRVKKLPEYPIEWRIALKRFPEITDHGKAFRCVKNDMCRTDI